MGLLSGFEHIVRENESLAPYTWFQLGGAAEYFAEPTSQEELSGLIERCREEEIQVRLLGGGSNLLVRDEGVPGMVIHLSAPAFGDISVQGNILTAGGGAKLAHVVSTSVRDGLGGLEQLVGVPGTVGGALHGNSGAGSSDIGQWTHSATVMTRSGEIATRQKDEMRFAYRQSSLDELVILSAQFQLEEEDSQELTKRMQKLWIVKKASQPLGGQNAGCIFKNPGGDNAAALIEQAGLKGTKVGAAEVSERHANFIIANPGATSSEVSQLIDLIRNTVRDQFEVELEMEVEIW